MSSELKLIYVNGLGSDWKNRNVYEFIFSDEPLNEIDGEEWNLYPASGKPSPPDEKYIKKVGSLTTYYKFDLVQDSSVFSVWDSIDGVVALAWENIDDYDEYPNSRVCFKFGDNIKHVEDFLYEKDLTLEYKIDKYEESES